MSLYITAHFNDFASGVAGWEIAFFGANSPKKATSQPGAQKRASSESYFSTCYSRRKIVKMCCDIQQHKLEAK